MKKVRNVAFITIFANVIVCSYSFASGSGAYRIEVPDARALSMGGSFVAVADSPATVIFNAAGMTQLQQSTASVGVALIQPKAHAEPDGGIKTKMQQDSFFVPSVFSVTRISEKIALGIGATSSWGLGTEWAQDSFARYVSTRTKMQNQDYLLNMAYKLNDQVSLGGGVVIDNSSIEKQRKINQFVGFGGAPDANYKLQGSNVAAGYQFSGLFKLNERHQFGVQYSSDIRRKYHGKVHLDGLDDASLLFYGAGAGGFGSSSYETDVVAKSVLPQSLDIGYAYKPTNKLTISTDVLWTDWSSTKKEEVAFPNETDAGRLAILGLGNPANRDWHSSLSFALGTEYLATDCLRLRGGYYYHQSPVPQDTFDTSMPDANSQSVAMGFGYDFTKALTLDFTYSAMFFDTRSVKNGVGDGVYGSIDGKYSQWVNMIATTATYKF